jgi:hypothetical protein
MPFQTLFQRHIEPRLIALLVWLNDRLLALNEKLTEFKQRRGL